jgi:hypothetical protein
LHFALPSSWLDGFGLHGKATSTRAAKFWADEKLANRSEEEHRRQAIGNRLSCQDLFAKRLPPASQSALPRAAGLAAKPIFTFSFSVPRSRLLTAKPGLVCEILFEGSFTLRHLQGHVSVAIGRHFALQK